ncbi:MAG: hypothetical protein AB7U82_04595 [Blastocatellales bacterium]
MRKHREQEQRQPSRLLLSLALLGMLSMFLDDDPTLQYARASLVNAVPAARAQAVIQSDTTLSSAKLKKIGEHQAIVFSPDFAAPGNREFYEGLGFVYWESADWRQVLREIKQFNLSHPEDKIRQVYFEAHGSNGNGLKLQRSKLRSAPRSYISLGALQEHLGEAGVERAILTACNTGRLYRPEIYKKLNMKVKDPNVLPATLGVINASKDFDPSANSVELVRRTDSRIEQTSEGTYSELPASVIRALGLSASTKHFSVSNMFIQMIIKDADLQLTSTGYVLKVSDRTESDTVNEAIFQSFLKFLDGVASDPTASAGANFSTEKRDP